MSTPAHGVAGIIGRTAGDTGGAGARAERLRALVPAAECDDALDGQLRGECIEMAARLHSAADETDRARLRPGEATGGEERDGRGPHRRDVFRVEDRDRQSARAVVHDDDSADVRKAARRVVGRETDRLEHGQRGLARSAEQCEGETAVSGRDARLRSFPCVADPLGGEQRLQPIRDLARGDCEAFHLAARQIADSGFEHRRDSTPLQTLMAGPTMKVLSEREDGPPGKSHSALFHGKWHAIDRTSIQTPIGQC